MRVGSFRDGAAEISPGFHGHVASRTQMRDSGLLLRGVASLDGNEDSDA